jgi:hypothetical protein
MDSFDAMLMDRVEDLYLWFFDRTGVSISALATVIFLVSTMTPLVDEGGAGLIVAVPIGALLIYVGREIDALQRNRTMWNTYVELYRKYPPRQVIYPLLSFTTIGLVMALLLAGRPDALVGLGYPVAIYLFVVRLRDRKTPPRKRFKPALNQI